MIPKERERITTFGALAGGDAYLPHITLGRLTNIGDTLEVSKLKVLPQKQHTRNFFSVLSTDSD